MTSHPACTTTELWARVEGPERVYLIKIDAEGGEYRVLCGGQGVLPGGIALPCSSR